MARLGFNPKRIVDVGAHYGAWTDMAKDIFPDAAVHMVEAQPSKAPALDEVASRLAGVTYSIALLGPHPAKAATFYEQDARFESGSSVLKEQSSVGGRAVTYPMQTLDDLLAKQGLGRADFLKLDVQGYELEVLKGASTTLGQAEAVLMEVSLIPINQGAPLLHEAVSFMADRGFRVYDVCSFIRRPLDRALWQSDFIFVSNESKLVENTTFDKCPLK